MATRRKAERADARRSVEAADVAHSRVAVLVSALNRTVEDLDYPRDLEAVFVLSMMLEEETAKLGSLLAGAVDAVAGVAQEVA